MRNPLFKSWREIFKRPFVRALGHTLERDTRQLISELRKEQPEQPKRRKTDRFK